MFASCRAYARLFHSNAYEHIVYACALHRYNKQVFRYHQPLYTEYNTIHTLLSASSYLRLTS